ncbi:MAG: HAMP domain-containing histidine kinase [Pseudomonadales bacterium]|nr:HAMP domain-containing histidine kinase [Pseudomonadales bacterium]
MIDSLNYPIEDFSAIFVTVLNEVLEAEISVQSEVSDKRLGFEQNGEFICYVELQGSSQVRLVMNCCETTAAAMIGISVDQIGSANADEKAKFRRVLAGSVREAMNTVAGKMLPMLQEEGELLTVRPVDLIYGTVFFPRFLTHSVSMTTNYGALEFAVCSDTTQTKVMKNLAEAEDLLESKNLFMANMSHEIRTPLNAIIGFTKIVLRKNTDQLAGRTLKALQTVEVSSNHLLELVNSVLDMNAIEAGKLQVNKQRMNITPIVADVFEMLNYLSIEKQLAARLDMQNEEVWVNGDALRIKEIIMNLYSNALKYTNEGSVVMRQVCTEDHVKIIIEDTGIGVKEEDKHRLFQIFSQIDDAYTKSYAGTGLGLALSQELAKLNDGGIDFQSVYAKGSVVTLELPLYH